VSRCGQLVVVVVVGWEEHHLGQADPPLVEGAGTHASENYLSA